MLVHIQPEEKLGIETFTVDPRFNETIEDLVYMVSLKVTSIPANELQLSYQGKLLKSSQTLESYSIQEGEILSLSKKSSGCCLLI